MANGARLLRQVERAWSRRFQRPGAGFKKMWLARLVQDRGANPRRAVQRILADGGYVGQPFAQAVEELLGAQVQIAKRSELHTFAVMPQRWVVERSFAWIEKCRRLWKNCERKLNASLQFIHLAFLALLLRRS